MNQEYYDNPGIYNDAPNTALISSQPMGIIPLEPLALSQPNSRFHRKIVQRAEMEATSERMKARLAQEVIINTTALSAIADRTSEAVPSSEPYTREVVRVYAQSSAQRIASRW